MCPTRDCIVEYVTRVGTCRTAHFYCCMIPPWVLKSNAVLPFDFHALVTTPVFLYNLVLLPDFAEGGWAGCHTTHPSNMDVANLP